ncbi:glycosyltransferase family 4 protein [soil metagenome]
MKRLNLVFCTDGIFPHAIGGMQRHSALLVEALAAMNLMDITVIHPHDKVVFNPALGIKEIAIPHTVEGNYLKSCYEYSKKVYETIKDLNADIIYGQGFSVWHGLPEIGHKVIINPHGLEPFQTISFVEKLKTTPMRFAERYQFKHAARIVSLGGRLTDILKDVVPNPETKIVVLPNAVNPAEAPERNFDKDVLQLLFVGRFAFNKGINVLMEGVRSMNLEGYKNRLIFNVVGKGPLYEQYIKEYNFPNVNFLGFADDDKLTQLYKENDLFVFPTRFEGMPTVVLEAMIAGMPIVVSDTGATCELVDSTNGFLIESNNVRSLKWGIQSFFQMTATQRMELSKASHKKVLEKFTWPKVAQMHYELFESLRS